MFWSKLTKNMIVVKRVMSSAVQIHNCGDVFNLSDSERTHCDSQHNMVSCSEDNYAVLKFRFHLEMHIDPMCRFLVCSNRIQAAQPIINARL